MLFRSSYCLFSTTITTSLFSSLEFRYVFIGENFTLAEEQLEIIEIKINEKAKVFFMSNLFYCTVFLWIFGIVNLFDLMVVIWDL